MQQELDTFFTSAQSTYTKSALSQHRSKLKPDIFPYLNKAQTDYYYTMGSHILKWKGFRLVAIDGSTMQLPYSTDLVKNFGHFETRTENNRKVVLARISQAYDVLNMISIDARIEHYQTSELSLATMHLSKLSNQDLLIMDRAYAAFWLMSLLEKEEKSFVIRVKANRWKLAKHFLQSGKKEQIVTITPSKEAVLRCKERKIPIQPLSLRLVRVPIESGEDHVLITNLTNREIFKCSDIRGLYRRRWPVEESFKHLKLRAELENLSGKTQQTVRQDFHRIIFRANLSMIISKSITYKGLKHINNIRKRHYLINRTQAYRKISSLINTLFRDIKKIVIEIENYALMLLNQTEIFRPGRSIPRIRRYSGKPANFIAYKP